VNSSCLSSFEIMKAFRGLSCLRTTSTSTTLPQAPHGISPVLRLAITPLEPFVWMVMKYPVIICVVCGICCGNEILKCFIWNIIYIYLLLWFRLYLTLFSVWGRRKQKKVAKVLVSFLSFFFFIFFFVSFVFFPWKGGVGHTTWCFDLLHLLKYEDKFVEENSTHVIMNYMENGVLSSYWMFFFFFFFFFIWGKVLVELL
jgi:hypothetical protein